MRTLVWLGLVSALIIGRGNCRRFRPHDCDAFCRRHPEYLTKYISVTEYDTTVTETISPLPGGATTVVFQNVTITTTVPATFSTNIGPANESASAAISTVTVSNVISTVTKANLTITISASSQSALISGGPDSSASSVLNSNLSAIASGSAARASASAGLNSTTSGSDKIPAGPAVGIAIGSLVAGALLGALGMWLWKRNPAQRPASEGGDTIGSGGPIPPGPPSEPGDRLGTA